MGRESFCYSNPFCHRCQKVFKDPVLLKSLFNLYPVFIRFSIFTKRFLHHGLSVQRREDLVLSDIKDRFHTDVYIHVGCYI